MKKIILIFIFLFLIKNLFAQEMGQTEITAEDGIEVFQDDKYYLLKKNVQILSKNFNLNADTVKAYYDKDLYDIYYIFAEGNVRLNAEERGLSAKGQTLEFTLEKEKIKVSGTNSELILSEASMFSDGIVEIDNLGGSFLIKGRNSTLVSQDVTVTGEDISGEFSTEEEINEIIKLIVKDKNISNIKTENIDMYSLKAIYDKKNENIELIDNVKVLRGNEIIIGDYGFVDIAKNSYKVSSNDSSKVKVLISQDNE